MLGRGSEGERGWGHEGMRMMVWEDVEDMNAREKIKILKTVLLAGQCCKIDLQDAMTASK
jgi:hypothetical protein